MTPRPISVPALFRPAFWRSLSLGPRMPKWLKLEVVAASFFINVLGLGLPVVILQVYNRIIPHQSIGTLELLMIGLVVALLADGILRICRSWLSAWNGARFEHETGNKLLRHILNEDLGRAEADAAGVHLDRLSAIDPVRDFYASQANSVIMDIPFAVIFLGVLAWIGGLLVAVPIVLLAAFGAAALLLNGRLHEALDRRGVWDTRRYNFLIELLGGIHTVKGLAIENAMLRRYERMQESAAEATLDVTRLSGLAQGLSASFSQVTMLAVASFGAMQVMQGELTIGALAACMLLGGRSVQPLLRGLSLWTQYQNVQIHERKLKGLIDAADVAREEKPAMPCISGAFEFHSIGLRYGDDDPFLFRKVNLKVKAGEIIAIRGADGSGRSTMLQILSGTRQATEGYVSFDGMKAADHSERSLREQIAYLPEKGVLFKGTVLDNITMFGEDELIDPAIELAGAVGLDREFARLPKGYDTIVGDSSVEYLPSGVIQRIAVVRALVRKPRLILFDEANSGLDFKSDNELRDLLASMRGQSTIVLVTHRPSMIRLADRVFDLKDRTFVEARDVEPAPAHAQTGAQVAS